MSTYSGKLNGPDYPDPKDNTTYDGPEIIETIANATQVGLGGPGVRAGAGEMPCRRQDTSELARRVITPLTRP